MLKHINAIAPTARDQWADKRQSPTTVLAKSANLLETREWSVPEREGGAVQDLARGDKGGHARPGREG